jgi:ribonuclease I
VQHLQLKNQLDAINNEAKVRVSQLHQQLDAEKAHFEQKELSLRMECDRLKEVVASLERDFG